MSFDERFEVSLEQATAVADILLELELIRDDRDEVYRSSNGYRAIVDWLHLEGGRGTEFRCVPGLGFGGKLWVTAHRPPYVSGYPEDATTRSDELTATANARLAELFGGQPPRVRGHRR